MYNEGYAVHYLLPSPCGKATHIGLLLARPPQAVKGISGCRDFGIGGSDGFRPSVEFKTENKAVKVGSWSKVLFANENGVAGSSRIIVNIPKAIYQPLVRFLGGRRVDQTIKEGIIEAILF